MKVEEGYYNRKDVLPVFEQEYEAAVKEGLVRLLEEMCENAAHAQEWYERMVNNDEI